VLVDGYEPHSVPLPSDVLQCEGPTQVGGIRDVLRRRRHEDLAQHRADRNGRLVKPSEGVRGRRSGREESDLGRGWAVVVWRHLDGRGMRWEGMGADSIGGRTCLDSQQRCIQVLCPSSPSGYGGMEEGFWFSFV